MQHGVYKVRSRREKRDRISKYHITRKHREKQSTQNARIYIYNIRDSPILLADEVNDEVVNGERASHTDIKLTRFVCPRSHMFANPK